MENAVATIAAAVALLRFASPVNGRCDPQGTAYAEHRKPVVFGGAA